MDRRAMTHQTYRTGFETWLEGARATTQKSQHMNQIGRHGMIIKDHGNDPEDEPAVWVSRSEAEMATMQLPMEGGMVATRVHLGTRGMRLAEEEAQIIIKIVAAPGRMNRAQGIGRVQLTGIHLLAVMDSLCFH